MSIPKLNGFDHFHLYVADKQRSANWYKAVLGFEICKELEFWNTDNGPLTIQDQSSTIHLALFIRKNQPPSTSIAFNSTGKEFLLWQTHLINSGLKLRLADHQQAWSIYFRDPDDNMHEITTYDYQLVADEINRQQL